jgi:CPA1 family monovalent cation:H+ antiporter
MRGVVTLAAAFVLPPDTPLRPVLVLAAFGVTAGSLLLQGTTLPVLMRAMHLRGPSKAEDALQVAGLLQQAGQAGLDALDELAADPAAGLPELTVEELRRRVMERTNAAWERLGPAEAELTTPSEYYRRARLTMLAAERAEVLRVRDSGSLDSDVVQSVLNLLDLEESTIDRLVAADDEIRAEPLRPIAATQPCPHLERAPVTQRPDHPGECSDCLAEGLTWVHLRMCLTCGHIACCDSSVGRHSDRHFRRTEHPVMRSVEPGEAWRWCYVDELLG